MAQRIEVQGMGILEFPDGMSDAEMAAAIDRAMQDQPDLILPQAPSGPPNLPPPSAAPQASQAYRGTILPFSKDEQGNVSFDSDAGILGAAKRAFMLPSQVYQGEIDPLSDEGIARATELASFATPINPAVRAGEAAIPGVLQNLRREAPPVPTAQELKAASGAGYDAVRDAGVDYAAPAVRDMATQLRTQLESDGFLPELTPKTFSILDRLEAPPDGAVATIGGLDAARKALKNARLDFTNDPERTAAKRVAEGIDRFIESPPEASVLAGPAAEAAALLRSARGNHAAGKRSETLTGIRDAADLRAAVANSGQNLDNATRQRLASLILNRKASAGFSAGEREAIEDVARGTPSTNAARYIGNLLGGGGGLGMAVTGALGSAGGAAAGGVSGAALGALIPPAIGAGAKQVAAAMTQRGLARVDEATRMRSPLYEQALANSPFEAAIDPRRIAVVRALMASQAGQH